MEDYYEKYLKNSNVYQNLTKAMANVKIQIEKLEDLEKTFSDVGGNVIDLIKDDISNLIAELTNYHTAIKDVCEKLNNNAQKFDVVYKKWKEKINTDFVSPEITEKNDVNGTVKSTLYKKINNVRIDQNGYIEIEVKCTMKKEIKLTPSALADIPVVSAPVHIDKGFEYYQDKFDGIIVRKLG